MTRTVGGGIEDLRQAINGLVIEPDGAEYGAARTVWNADIDRSPSVIVRCASTEDVVAAVAFAREHGLEIAVRGGGHSMSGTSVVDGGLMIDLSRLNQVTVDPAAKTALVGGGALLAELDAATQAYGLAVPAGLISHTGVGGLTLGGGMGWLSRQAGLSIDNLISAQVVTADGRILRASNDENADLFWAIRGGGGNFGVVTEFEFRLHEVGPIVQCGLMFWGAEQGQQLLQLARETLAALPRDHNILIAGMNAPPAPFVPEEHHFKPGYSLAVVGFGSAEAHEAVLDRLSAALPPLFQFVTPMPYVAVQQMFDEPNSWGNHYYEKSLYLDDLTDDAVQVITEHLPRKGSPLSALLVYRLDEAYEEVAEDATAFSGSRTPQYAVFVVANCPVPELLPGEREWVRSFAAALQPHAKGAGTYINALGEPDDDRIRASYGTAKYERLAGIKGHYDPDNVFHRNANIKPA